MKAVVAVLTLAAPAARGTQPTSSTRVPGSNAARRRTVGMGTQALGRIVTGHIIVAPTAPHDEGDPMEYPPHGGEPAA